MSPTLDTVAARYYDAPAQLSPTDPLIGWPLATFCQGLGLALQPFDDLARERGGVSGPDRLLDPDLAPSWALPWLAMCTGTRLPTTLPDEAAREAIKQSPGQDRGTAPAIIGVARRHTSDPANALAEWISPYNGSVHEGLLIVYADQDPDPDAIERDLRDVQPAWMKITVRIDLGWSIADMEAAYAGQTIADLEGDFATIADLEGNLPS